eukprot:scaffold1166_cov261-Pinguiococcus_pyrenoidosus.AAC.55
MARFSFRSASRSLFSSRALASSGEDQGLARCEPCGGPAAVASSTLRRRLGCLRLLARAPPPDLRGKGVS